MPPEKEGHAKKHLPDYNMLEKHKDKFLKVLTSHHIMTCLINHHMSKYGLDPDRHKSGHYKIYIRRIF